MELTKYVQQVSLEDFGKPFRHWAVWNSRLRTTGGRFFPKDGHLDFNPKMYREVDELTFRKIVRHELCHYHLYFEKKGYKHGDRDFQDLLTQVDGLRYAPRLAGATSATFHYQCQACQQAYHRKRRVDVTRYRCGRCRGSLVLLNQSEG